MTTIRLSMSFDARVAAELDSFDQHDLDGDAKVQGSRVERGKGLKLNLRL